MKNIKHTNLDLIYSNLIFAYYSNNEVAMQNNYDEFQREYPESLGQMESCVLCVFYENNCLPGDKVSIYSIFGSALKFNIEGCLRTIKSILNENNTYSFSLGSIQTIYYPEIPFNRTDVLYSEPETVLKAQPNVKTTLTVSDLLSVADYSIKVLDLINPDERTQDISDTITILKSIDLALNNKPEDKPLNKSLHIVNSVLSSVVKKSLDNKKDKQLTTSMGLLIDLAIDFFCKK